MKYNLLSKCDKILPGDWHWFPSYPAGQVQVSSNIHMPPFWQWEEHSSEIFNQEDLF